MTTCDVKTAIYSLLALAKGCGTSYEHNTYEEDVKYIEDQTMVVEEWKRKETTEIIHPRGGASFQSLEDLVWDLVADMCGEEAADAAQGNEEHPDLDRMRETVDQVVSALRSIE